MRSVARRILDVREYRGLLFGVLRHDCRWGDTVALPYGLSAGSREFCGWRSLAMVVLLGELGLRVSEAVGLEWAALSPALRGSPVVALPAWLCKGKRGREAVLTPVAWWALSCWAVVAEERWGDVESGWVLGQGASGRPYSPRGVQKHVGKLGKRYVGEAITPHTLRRTFGDRCRRLGDLRLAQLALGHKRLASTERYLAGSLPERMRLAVETGRELWPGGPPGVTPCRWGEAVTAEPSLPAPVVDRSGRS
jgi:integrase